MQLIDILAYVAALVPFTISPGPLIAIIIARCVSGDGKGAAGFAVGMTLGYVALMGLVCVGLGAWLQSIPGVLETIKYLALGYFFWIAYGIWQGSSNSTETEYQSDGVFGSVAAGITTSMASPHVILFFILLTPRLMNMNNVTISQFTLAATVTMVALMVSLGAIIFAFHKFGTAFTKRQGSGPVNKAMAAMVAMAGIWMVTA